MKSHDFGQFLFNSSTFSKRQLEVLINAAKHSEPTLAVESLYLQLVSADELTGIFRSTWSSLNESLPGTMNERLSMRSPQLIQAIDENVGELITPRQAARAEELKSGQSLWMAQALIDNNIANYLKLERIMDAYNSLAIPPLEWMITQYYDVFKTRKTIDFPFAIDLLRDLHAFMSEMLQSTVILLPPTMPDNETWLGVSVKVAGEIPVVVGLLADAKMFFRLAQRYEEIVEEVEDAFDALAELLNVFVGHFTVNAATRRGIEAEPEPPRFGEIVDEQREEVIELLTELGIIYVYVGRDEIFD